MIQLHSLATRFALSLGTHHMMEEAAHVLTYLDSPIKAAAVALAALFTHHSTSHSH